MSETFEVLPPIDLIDTHCHLTALSNMEVSGVIERAATANVRRMICIGAVKGEESIRRALELADTFSPIYASFGVHPHDAGEFNSLESLQPIAFTGAELHSKIVAIGETGLDFFRDWSPYDRQYQLFESSVALAGETKKPLVIHCRSAENETLEFLTARREHLYGGVFHCFSGDYDYAKKILDLGFLISVAGALTFKSAHALRETVAKIPLESLMLETDSPYMAPEPFRGRPSEPQHVLQVAYRMAEIKGLLLEAVAKQTTANAERLFGLGATRSAT